MMMSFLRNLGPVVVFLTDFKKGGGSQSQFDSCGEDDCVYVVLSTCKLSVYQVDRIRPPDKHRNVKGSSVGPCYS